MSLSDILRGAGRGIGNVGRGIGHGVGNMAYGISSSLDIDFEERLTEYVLHHPREVEGALPTLQRRVGINPQDAHGSLDDRVEACVNSGHLGRNPERETLIALGGYDPDKLFNKIRENPGKVIPDITVNVGKLAGVGATAWIGGEVAANVLGGMGHDLLDILDWGYGLTGSAGQFAGEIVGKAAGAAGGFIMSHRLFGPDAQGNLRKPMLDFLGKTIAIYSGLNYVGTEITSLLDNGVNSATDLVSASKTALSPLQTWYTTNIGNFTGLLASSGLAAASAFFKRSIAPYTGGVLSEAGKKALTAFGYLTPLAVTFGGAWTATRFGLPYLGMDANMAQVVAPPIAGVAAYHISNLISDNHRYIRRFTKLGAAIGTAALTYHAIAPYINDRLMAKLHWAYDKADNVSTWTAVGATALATVVPDMIRWGYSKLGHGRRAH